VKWQILILICLLFIGCAAIPDPPPLDFGGVMVIRVIKPADADIDYVRSMFLVKGKQKEFYIYFQDKYNMPRGKVIVEKGRVVEADIPFKKDAEKIFKYWTYLFNSKDIIQISAKGVRIKYLSRTEVSGSNLPNELEISTSDIILNIKINYGN
jgi:hypothetical protein